MTNVSDLLMDPNFGRLSLYCDDFTLSFEDLIIAITNTPNTKAAVLSATVFKDPLLVTIGEDPNITEKYLINPRGEILKICLRNGSELTLFCSIEEMSGTSFDLGFYNKGE